MAAASSSPDSSSSRDRSIRHTGMDVVVEVVEEMEQQVEVAAEGGQCREM